MMKLRLLAGLILSLNGVRAAGHWPEFRGPTGQGTATAVGLPVEWSPQTNVVWKQPVPGAGWSSPVIAGGRIFLTTGITGAGAAEGVSLRALAFDEATGRALWETEVFSASEASVQPTHAKNSPASPTPIIEGNRVYVHFGHHGTACLDLNGKVLWRNNRLGYDPVHGSGGSPALADDRLIINADGAKDPFVAALDKTSGEVLWKVPRTAKVRQNFSFATPLVINVNGHTQIITPGSGAVSALDPKDGREIWSARYGSGYSVVPRPVFAHGMVFVATGYGRADLLAIRVDGQGDVTDTHIAWRVTKGAPLTPSVVVVGDELYAVADIGLASCFDARTGTLHWQERLEGNYSSSPVAADGKIYFQNENGIGTVLKASREFVKLAENNLEERSLASYAVADGTLYIRTANHLYRIGNSGRANRASGE